MKMPSKTDWVRIDQMSDEEIDTFDNPPLDDEFFANAEWRMPEKKTVVTLSIDSEVLNRFESQGADFPQRVSGVKNLRTGTSGVRRNAE